MTQYAVIRVARYMGAGSHILTLIQKKCTIYIVTWPTCDPWLKYGMTQVTMGTQVKACCAIVEIPTPAWKI